MTDKTELHRQISLGQRAKAILSDEIVIEARRMVRLEILDAWEKSPARDTEGREALYQMLKLHERVWGRLEQVLADGKMADAELPENERRGLLKL